MTIKQEERLRNKIIKIKAALAADKKLWGGYYHDGQGLRYLPPQYYIQLSDFSGGLRYMNWFKKNFPNDAGFPDFLFEWAIILFKTNRVKEAERKIFETFTRNTYLLAKFFGKPISPIDKWEGSNLETAEYTNYFNYSHHQDNLSDFTEWLNKLIETEKFITLSDKYIEIYILLQKENNYETRKLLIEQADQLIDGFEH